LWVDPIVPSVAHSVVKARVRSHDGEILSLCYLGRPQVKATRDGHFARDLVAIFRSTSIVWCAHAIGSRCDVDELHAKRVRDDRIARAPLERLACQARTGGIEPTRWERSRRRPPAEEPPRQKVYRIADVGLAIVVRITRGKA